MNRYGSGFHDGAAFVLRLPGDGLAAPHEPSVRIEPGPGLRPQQDQQRERRAAPPRSTTRSRAGESPAEPRSGRGRRRLPAGAGLGRCSVGRHRHAQLTGGSAGRCWCRWREAPRSAPPGRTACATARRSTRRAASGLNSTLGIAGLAQLRRLDVLLEASNRADVDVVEPRHRAGVLDVGHGLAAVEDVVRAAERIGHALQQRDLVGAGVLWRSDRRARPARGGSRPGSWSRPARRPRPLRTNAESP